MPRKSRLETSISGQENTQNRVRRTRSRSKKKSEVIITPEVKRTIAKSTVIALIIALVTELLCDYAFHSFPGFSIFRLLALTVCYLFAVLNITLKWTLYEILIRYAGRIFTVMIVLTSIYGKILNSKAPLGLFLISKTMFLSPIWNIKFYLLVYATFKLMMIITGREKYSVLGTYFIVFSAFIQYNFELITPILVGELLIVSALSILLGKKTGLNAIIFVISAGMLVSTNNALTLPFMLIFAAIFIWILIDYKEEYTKYGQHITFLITLAVAILAMLIASKAFPSNYYYNADINYNKSGIQYINGYLNNFIHVFIKYKEPITRYGSFISVFPMPLIVALMILYKGDKHISFMLPISIVTAFETIFCLVGLPETISVITHFNTANYVVCAAAINFSSILIAMYIISNVEEKMFELVPSMRLTMIVVVIMALIDQFQPVEKFSSRGFMFLFVSENAALIFLFLNWTIRRYRNGFFTLMLFFVLLSGLFINPITGRYNTYITVDELSGEEVQSLTLTKEYTEEYILDKR